jgi:hypothetical protein
MIVRCTMTASLAGAAGRQRSEIIDAARKAF